jgi:SAM-dependent methyltransferase
MRRIYNEDLAYIHNVGLGDFIDSASPGILEFLHRHGVGSGLVVDLGCGSGVLAATLVAAGYQVLGVDASAAMIRLARRRVPAAKFVASSAQNVKLPACAAVTATGETFNYLTSTSRRSGLRSMFYRIFAALQPGGIFIFDVAEPVLARAENNSISFARGKDWEILREKQRDPSGQLLTRRIVAFRKIGSLYRRSEEVHWLRLYDRSEVMSMLRDAGFSAHVTSRYGHQRLLAGRVGFCAVKSRQAPLRQSKKKSVQTKHLDAP